MWVHLGTRPIHSGLGPFRPGKHSGCGTTYVWEGPFATCAAWDPRDLGPGPSGTRGHFGTRQFGTWATLESGPFWSQVLRCRSLAAPTKIFGKKYIKRLTKIFAHQKHRCSKLSASPSSHSAHSTLCPGPKMRWKKLSSAFTSQPWARDRDRK